MYKPQQIVSSILPRFTGASRPSPEGLNLCAHHVSRFDPFGVVAFHHALPPVSPGAIHVEALRASTSRTEFLANIPPAGGTGWPGGFLSLAPWLQPGGNWPRSFGEPFQRFAARRGSHCNSASLGVRHEHRTEAAMRRTEGRSLNPFQPASRQKKCPEHQYFSD